MELENDGGILDKINELRALFIFGQRVIPFLEELFYFVNDMAPILEEINSSIYESTRRIPRASSQLSKVTEETEVATKEILDNLDGVLGKLDKIDANFHNAVADLTNLEALDDEMSTIVRRSLGPNKLKALNEISAIQERKRSHIAALRSNAAGLEKNLKLIRRSSNDIMMSLQVQDITAQQIASVNHLIQSVQERLSGIIDRFKMSGDQVVDKIDVNGDVAFDPLAVYDRSDKRQKTADEIINKSDLGKRNPDTLRHQAPNPASQDEIDRLFRKG